MFKPILFFGFLCAVSVLPAAEWHAIPDPAPVSTTGQLPNDYVVLLPDGSITFPTGGSLSFVAGHPVNQNKGF